MKMVKRNEQVFECKNGDKLKTSSRSDGKAVILESVNRKSSVSGVYRFSFTKDEMNRFLDELAAYLNEWGIKYTPEDRCYSEEINVYRDLVERSISTTPGKQEFHFIAYTDSEDDYWSYLTPNKLRYFVELMLPGLKAE